MPRYRPLGGDRGRVAAGLAAGDPRERGRAAAAAAAPRSSCGADAAMPSAPSVAGPAMPSTVSPWARWKRRTARAGDRAERAVGRHAERALEGDDGAAAGTRLERAATGARGRHGAAWAVGGDGRAGDQRHGGEQGARPAAAGPLSPGSLGGLGTTTSRGAQRREPGTRGRGIEVRHSYLLGLGAYGVSCRARAKTCATPRSGGDSPREPCGSIGSPVPRRAAAGIRRVTSLRARKDRHISPRSAPDPATQLSLKSRVRQVE